MVNFDRDKKRILLVEDNEDARGITAFILNEYELSYARNFGEGRRLARQQYFDLYIIDDWLPDRSGAELCRLIRSSTRILRYCTTRLPPIRVICRRLLSQARKLTSSSQSAPMNLRRWWRD